MISTSIKEQNALTAFDRQAPVFDQLYGHDTIIKYKRKRVRDHVNAFLQPGSHILELNAGTGEDAIYFASRGHYVHATDISTAMRERLANKINHSGMNDRVTTEICSYTSLNELNNKGPYDHIFSNFAGLNCTADLDIVLDSLDNLLKPGGMVTLVVLPKFCLWELLLAFRGRWRTAFRRFAGKRGAPAHIEGVHFRCWYYSPVFIQKRLKGKFVTARLEGLCTIAPPSYMEGFAEKHPKLFKRLVKWEDKWKSSWPWHKVGDYFIISMRKTAASCQQLAPGRFS